MECNFDKVYEDNYEKLYQLAYRLMGNREEAEDVLQEAFLNAYSSYSKFENKSQVSTWLYRIVINCANKNMKKLKKLPVVDIAARFNMTKEEFFQNKLKSYESVENEVMINSMREQCLQVFLKCMPSKQRIAFVLKVFLGLPYEDVATIMGSSVGAAKNNVYRARLRMQENMVDKCSYINPNYPCQCKNWVAYAIENNKMDMIPTIHTDKEIDYYALFKEEMNFLDKVAFLYDNCPGKMSYESFIEKIKDMISEKSLKILS